MFGQKNYKLPGSKKPQASVEPEESIEVGEPYDDEIDTFEASRTDDLAYEDDEYYDDEDYEDMIPSGDSNYYFEAQEEEEKPAPPRMVAFESNRRDINSFEQLVDKVEKEEALEQSEKQEEAPKGFNPRDENEPFLPPPGYVWSSEMFVRLPFWNMDHLLNAIGIGESSKRYMGGIDSDKWFEAEYGPVRNEDSLLLDGGLSETETLTKKSNVTPPIITAEMRAKYLEEMQAADDNPISAGDIVLASAFIPVEPEEGPPGWQIWRGERWDRFWNGYGTPTSYTGYPVQWFYRTVHFLFPETIDEFEYEHHAGELSLRYVQQFTYWFFTHPCIPTMLLHGSLVFPFFFWKRRLPYRQKIIENRMARGRSLFRTMDEHVSSIILRRLRPPRNRTTKRLYVSPFADLFFTLLYCILRPFSLFVEYSNRICF